MSGIMIDVTDDTFANEVEQADLPVLVDFSAPWCGPCRSFEPILNEIAQIYQGRVKFVKVNYDDNKALVERFGVTAIPAMFLVKHGELIENVSRGRSKSALANLLDSHVEAAAPVATSRTVKSWRAFYGDVALKQAVISRVRERIDADQVRKVGKVPPVCDREQGHYSLIGAALDGTDLERYEGTLGIPAEVAVLEEFVHLFAMNELTDAQGTVYYTFRAPRNKYPMDWLEAIPLGADLQRVPSRFLHDLLLELIDTPLPFGKFVAETIKIEVRDVAALHARSSGGESISPDDWKAARMAAGRAIPGHKDDRVSKAVVSLAEIVAWPTEKLGELHEDLLRAIATICMVLEPAAIQAAYSAEQWATRQETLRIAKERQRSEPGISREALEATDEVKAYRALQKLNDPVDKAQSRKLTHELGDRFHRILMSSLALATPSGSA